MLLRGRAANTSTPSTLTPEMMATIDAKCAQAQVNEAMATYKRMVGPDAPVVETFAIGDVVLVAAQDLMLRKKEVKGGRWNCVARIHGVNKISKSFYILRFMTQGHRNNEVPGSISSRYIFGNNLTRAPPHYWEEAERADQEAASKGDQEEKDGNDFGDDTGDSKTANPPPTSDRGDMTPTEAMDQQQQHLSDRGYMTPTEKDHQHLSDRGEETPKASDNQVTPGKAKKRKRKSPGPSTKTISTSEDDISG